MRCAPAPCPLPAARHAANPLQPIRCPSRRVHLCPPFQDIKPENFMLTAPPTTHPGYDEDADAVAGARGDAGAVGSRLKLIDFGLSVFCTGARCGLGVCVKRGETVYSTVREWAWRGGPGAYQGSGACVPGLVVLWERN